MWTRVILWEALRDFWWEIFEKSKFINVQSFGLGNFKSPTNYQKFLMKMVFSSQPPRTFAIYIMEAWGIFEKSKFNDV